MERFLAGMAGGLDGPAAEGKDLKINLVLTDLKQSHVLRIENSVLHFRAAAPAAEATATLSLTKGILVKMIAGTAGVKDTLLGDGLKVDGSKIDLLRFFGLIEKAPGTFPIVTR
jgi:alkyl sulfatase BDS1-like metallo-beta-lactamase superfamily hydrolase